MSSSEQLYTEISGKLEQFHSQLHRRRLANWVWVIVGMILAKSVQLSAIANHIPDSTEATARIAKVRRWLKNPHIDTQTLYQPIIHRTYALIRFEAYQRRARSGVLNEIAY